MISVSHQFVWRSLSPEEAYNKLLRLRKADRDVDASFAWTFAAIASEPGIPDQNAALCPFGSTGPMMRTIISKKFTGALFQEPSKQCELLLALLFFFLTGCQNGPKWAKNAPNGRYHAPDFSFKNAKLRLNIIIINILRAARVFIAFTFPQPSENEV